MFGHRKKRKDNRETFYIQWHLSDCCNLHCAHCYQGETQRTLDMEKAMLILDKLDAFFAGKDFRVQINLTGGEPLLYPGLFKIIDEIKKRNWFFAILTNGLLLNDTNISELSKRNPVFVQVSLEGPKEINDRCRGEGTFVQILKAIDMLNDAGIKTLVSFTITHENWRHFGELAEICRQHKVHKLWSDRFVGKGSLCVTTPEYSEFLETLRTEAKKKSSTKISAERSLQFMAGGSGYICGAGRSLLVFMPDGTMLPCRRLELPLGNIFSGESIEEILDKSDIWHDLSRPLFSADCIRCPDLLRCRGGAKCVTYAQTGDYHKKDVNCPKS